MPIGKENLRKTRSSGASGSLTGGAEPSKATDTGGVSAPKDQSKAKPQANSIKRSRASKEIPIHSERKPSIHADQVNSGGTVLGLTISETTNQTQNLETHLPTPPSTYIVVAPKSGFLPTFGPKTSSTQAVELLISDIQRICDPLTPRQLRALRRHFRTDQDLHTHSIQDILQFHPQQRDKNHVKARKARSDDNPNGPPVSSDRAFYFHHTDPLFKKSFPNSPLLPSSPVAASPPPDVLIGRSRAPSPSSIAQEDHKTESDGPNALLLDLTPPTTPSFLDGVLSSLSAVSSQSASSDPRDLHLEDDFPVFSQTSKVFDNPWNDNDSDLTAGDKRKRAEHAELPSKRGKRS